MMYAVVAFTYSGLLAIFTDDKTISYGFIRHKTHSLMIAFLKHFEVLLHLR